MKATTVTLCRSITLYQMSGYQLTLWYKILDSLSCLAVVVGLR